jgi:hypothetical protein
MDLKKFDFPKLTSLDIAFSSVKTDKGLLDESIKRGFYNGRTKYNELFSSLFFKGGKIEFKKDLDEEFKNKALPYLKSFMSSFEPSHEEKSAICAMLLSELVE